MAPWPDRHGRLHGLAAHACSSRAVSATLKRAGRGERRILAERMAGDELDRAGEAEALLALQHAHDRQRHGHQRRLGILGQRQGLDRALRT